jgi:hypothetical protein
MKGILVIIGYTSFFIIICVKTTQVIVNANRKHSQEFYTRDFTQIRLKTS